MPGVLRVVLARGTLVPAWRRAHVPLPGVATGRVHTGPHNAPAGMLQAPLRRHVRTRLQSPHRRLGRLLDDADSKRVLLVCARGAEEPLMRRCAVLGPHQAIEGDPPVPVPLTRARATLDVLLGRAPRIGHDHHRARVRRPSTCWCQDYLSILGQICTKRRMVPQVSRRRGQRKGQTADLPVIAFPLQIP